MHRPEEVASLVEEIVPSPAMARKKGKPADPDPGGLGGSSSNERTLPDWMDEKGEHGQLIVLLMSPAQRDDKLPTNPFTISKPCRLDHGRIP